MAAAAAWRERIGLKTRGQEVSVTRVDPQLNFVWYHQSFVISPLDDLRARLAEQLYVGRQQREHVGPLGAGRIGESRARQAHWAFLEFLTVTRQKDWAHVLLAHPVLLADCTTGRPRICIAAAASGLPTKPCNW